jgi:hypothetical protein
MHLRSVLLLVCYWSSRRMHVMKWLSLDRSLRWARTVQLTPTWQLLPIRWTQGLVSMNCDAGLLSLPAQADKVHARYGNSVILTLVRVVQAISPWWECCMSEDIISVANIHLWNTFLLLLEILEKLGLCRFGKDKFNQDLNASFLIGSYSGQISNHWMHLSNVHEQFWFQAIECIFCVSVNSCHFLFITVSWLLISCVVNESSICVVATLKPKTILF